MIRPTVGKVVLKKEATPDKTKGGIILSPSSAEESAIYGKIVATGLAMKDVPFDGREGDRVAYYRQAGIEVTHDDTKFVVINHADILFIV